MESKHNRVVQIDINSLHEMIVKLQKDSESQAIKLESQASEIEKLKKNEEQKDKEIETLKQKMENVEKKNEALEQKNEELKQENKRLKQENEQIKIEIKNVLEDEIQAIVNQPKKTKIPRKKHENSDSEQTSYTDSEEETDQAFDAKCENVFESMRSEKFDPIQGFIDTITFFSNSDRSKSQKLKEYACYGKNEELSKEASKNNNIVNKRGTPDSLFSRLKGFYDKTPLMIAAQYGNLQAVKELIKNGAKTDLYDRDFNTALDYANQNHQWEVAEFLRTKNAKSNTEIEELREQLTDKFKLT